MVEKRLNILKMIADDMKNDAKNFDGKPLTGRTVAEYFGNQGAAIAAIADIVRSILEEDSPLCPKRLAEKENENAQDV